MSSIIQAVTFNPDEAKKFVEKLGDHIGMHTVEFYLKDGNKIQGIPSEVGLDYVMVLEELSEILIPLENISFFRFSR